MHSCGHIYDIRYKATQIFFYAFTTHQHVARATATRVTTLISAVYEIEASVGKTFDLATAVYNRVSWPSHSRRLRMIIWQKTSYFPRSTIQGGGYATLPSPSGHFRLLQLMMKGRSTGSLINRWLILRLTIVSYVVRAYTIKEWCSCLSFIKFLISA